jgi:hypothetical protein
MVAHGVHGAAHGCRDHCCARSREGEGRTCTLKKYTMYFVFPFTESLHGCTAGHGVAQVH